VQRVALKFAEPAKLLIVIGIAYSLAQSGWYFLSDPHLQPIGDAPRSAIGQNRQAPMSISEIIESNLFGDAGAGAARTVADDNPPDTRLRLTLEGVFRADNADQSAAIVAEQGRPGELYVIGESMPGNAVLTEVFQDRIVFRRGANYETLRFSEETPLLTNDSPVAAAASSGPLSPGQSGDPRGANPRQRASAGVQSPGATSDRSLDEVVADYRDRLQSDPEGTLNNLGLQPISSGAAEGYRLGNLAQSPYLSQTGLQAGDIILSVNGNPVGNVAQDQMQIDNIMAQGSARLEVQRGDRRFFVTASLR
jgi:general secretion pathway protein C